MEYTKRNIIETQRNRYASLGTALLLIALALVSCSSLTQTASKTITFDYEVDWETIGDRRILFKTDIDGDFDLYVADGYADQLRRLTNDPYHNKYADPSPDGTQVVYSSNRDGGDFVHAVGHSHLDPLGHIRTCRAHAARGGADGVPLAAHPADRALSHQQATSRRGASVWHQSPLDH